MTKDRVSACGTHVASLSGSLLRIHSKQQGDRSHWDLGHVLSKHSEDHGLRREFGPVKVSCIEWELPLVTHCTKLALCVSQGSLTLILVLELNRPNPIVIEADPIGVSRIQWIGGSEQDSGSYQNCTQLAIFLAFSLHTKVYSLLTTTLQFTVPKPFTNHAISHPKKPNIWSLMVTPYHHKNLISRSVFKDETSLKPVMLHFWNDGITSRLIASLALDFIPGENLELLWSSSGKWLLLFDSSSTLSGYLVSVYNIFGVHTNKFKDIVAHTAQPTVKFTSEPVCLLHGADLTWIPILNVDDGQDMIFMVSISEELTLHYKCHDLALMLTLKHHKIALKSCPIWSQTTDTRGVKYTKLKYIPYKATQHWSNVATSGSVAILAAGNLVVALRVIQGRVEVIFTIVADLEFVTACISGENTCFIAFTDHIVACNSSTARVIAAATDYQFTHMQVTETDGKSSLHTIEDHPTGPVWKQKMEVFETSVLLKPLSRPFEDTYLFERERREPNDPTASRELTDTFYGQKRRKL